MSINGLEEQGHTWRGVQRALCQRFGLKQRQWFIAHGKVSRYRYWVTLGGPEAKTISTRGVLRELFAAAPP